MTTNLQFDFSVDKENKQITVKREFAAPLKDVWAAWTQKEILDQWWAPKPYVTKTKTMDFREGGFWLYAMVGPQNDTHWCRADYKSVVPMKSYSALDGFCDETGTQIKNDFPRSLWNVTFNEIGENTFVNIIVKYDKVEDLEMIIKMGFKEGFTMALGNLDELFKK